MTDRVILFLNTLKSKEYRGSRKTFEYPDIPDDRFMNAACSFTQTEKAETPILYKGDIFGFNRTVKNPAGSVPWRMNNFTPDYAWAMQNGFSAIRKDLHKRGEAASEDRKGFFLSAAEHIDGIFDLSERYREYAEKNGVKCLADAIKNVPANKPENYYEALVFIKIIIYSLRASYVDHVTLGRFDQYMYPYYLALIRNGATEKEILEQTELFFISLNLDTDLYCGVQQGDNGQSLVLGGKTPEKADAYNELSEIVMTAAEELCLIDPKINLRVNKNTPLSRFIRATRLTKKGLGFPQYLNDDVVIPGLEKLGYEYKDACDYAVAACWEFIIPAESYDVSNIVTMNFPLVVRRASMCSLRKCDSYDEFFTCVCQSLYDFFEQLKIKAAGDHLSMKYCNPYASLYVRGCREKGLDYTEHGAKYNNDGVHGLGIAPAVDALAAIKKLCFDEKTLDKSVLVKALAANFEGFEEVRNRLLACPKTGNNDELTNGIMSALLDFYAETVDNVQGSVGGVFRAGTGGSMDYVTMSRGVGATADGRKAGQPYPASFSPSIGVKANGPLSVVQTFTSFDMTKIINGGPLTLEMHDNVFRNDEGIEKVAALVKTFISLGGHELQLNSISRERLLDAQAHPEKYPDLIVRVWGWSGYFNELDVEYQNHVISRTEYGD